ncbi:MAG: hypothetical protein R3185_08880, partial [Candidatus Thermoplasmatota archaeon]|nr:hypothetical protein [Candidatus Thermoplasmatota archaeon]
MTTKGEAPPDLVLELFIAGESMRSKRALAALRGTLNDMGVTAYELTVIDVLLRPDAAIERRNGVLVSMVAGKALAYALYALQERGKLIIDHGTEVYEG